MAKPLFSLLVAVSLLGFARSPVSAQEVGLPKRLAPGVLRVVGPELSPIDAGGRVEPLPDLKVTPYQPGTIPLADTLSTRASDIVLRRDIWGVEFAYKPLRMIEVDVPQASGKMQRKVVWYLVFRVRFDGQVMANLPSSTGGANEIETALTSVERSSIDEIRLFPTLSLTAAVIDPITGDPTYKEYLDRVMPTAISQIRESEDPNQPLASTVSISAEPIYRRGDANFEVGKEYWGVATWEDVDPRSDYVSIQIAGLTNAFEVEHSPTGKRFRYKTLQLNFYRPGDEIDETKDRIRPGIPLVDDPREQLDLCRLYRLPGPQLVASSYDPAIDVTYPIERLETNQNATLETLEATELDGGSIPPALSDALAVYGYDLTGASVKTIIEGNRWTVAGSREGKSVDLRVDLVPRLWKRVGNHFEFNERLEAFWSYR